MEPNFESHIQGEKPVVVDFSAKWCAPCKLMVPVLHSVRETVGDRATILQLDIDDDPQYAQLYNVLAVPTVIIFKNGQVIFRRNGVVAASEILHQLAHLIL